VPDVAVTVTVYDPGESFSRGATVRVAVPKPPDTRVKLLGERFVLSLPTEAVADSDTLPANPFKLVREIVDTADPPRETLRDEGFAEMLKSPVVEDVTVRDTCVA
jgi:hypothetical protein